MYALYEGSSDAISVGEDATDDDSFLAPEADARCCCCCCSTGKNTHSLLDLRQFPHFEVGSSSSGTHRILRRLQWAERSSRSVTS